MAVRLNTNLASINAQGQAKRLNEDIQNSTQKIASGSRITRASDDAASLALSEKFKANIRSASQSARNANDAVSVIQTMEGNLQEISNMASKMRELAIQASTDTMGAVEKELANKEFQQLKLEIKRISGASGYLQGTTPSGTSELLQAQLVDRAPKSFDFKVGGNSSGADNTIKFRPSQLQMSISDYNIDGLSVASKASARASLADIDRMVDKVMFTRASLGALQSQLSRAVNVSDTTVENSSAANSRVRDVDYAQETATNVKSKLVSEVNTAVMAQANVNPKTVLKLIS